MRWICSAGSEWQKLLKATCCKGLLPLLYKKIQIMMESAGISPLIIFKNKKESGAQSLSPQ